MALEGIATVLACLHFVTSFSPVLMSRFLQISDLFLHSVHSVLLEDHPALSVSLAADAIFTINC